MEMKVVAGLMIVIGLGLGYGAVLELGYYGPHAMQFWVGVITTPALVLFVVGGVLLWLRGQRMRHVALVTALVMACATIAATALGVMGPPATIAGMLGAIVVIVWFWRTRDSKYFLRSS